MRIGIVSISFVLTAAVVHGQSVPRISLVQPAGGQAGTSVKIAVVGQNLDAVEALHFNFPGAKVEVLQAERVLVDPKKKGGGGGMKATADAVAQNFVVTLPSGVAPGVHDLRVVTKSGISNPRAFVIGDRPESTEVEPNNDVPQATKIPLNTTINGVIDKGTDIDYFQVSGKKGQRIVAVCSTSSIESKLPATLEFYTLSGRRLASNRNYQNLDAVVDAILPEDGDYLLRIASFTYSQGGVDHFYRLTVGDMPWIDAVIPAAVEPGKETKVEVLGRNLPGGVLDRSLLLDGRPLERATVTIKAPGEELARQRLNSANLLFPAGASLDGFDLRLASPSGSSNAFLVKLAKSPVSVEVEPNDSSEKGNLLTTPAQVSGRIDRVGDIDWYRFAAKKDVPMSIELFADRLAPSVLSGAIDLRFVIVSPKGKIIATQDDAVDLLANSFYIRTSDPGWYRFVPNEDGEYQIGVSSADGSFGPRHGYSLRVAPEDGDFRAIAMPSSPISPDSVVQGANGHYALTIFVWRLGSFTGDVTITGKKLPPGVTVPPQVISGSQKQGAVVISVAENAPPFTGAIELEATAMIDGRKTTREVRSATITHPVGQAGPPVLSRLDRELVLAVRDRAKYALAPAKSKLSVTLGEKVELAMTMRPLNPEFKSTVQLVAASIPTGLTLPATTLSAGKETTVVFDAKATLLPGRYNLVLRGQTQPPSKKPPVKGAIGNDVEHSPPIELTVVPKSLLKLTPPGPTKIGVGQEGMAVVQLSRLFPFDGPIEVEPLAPKGVTASPLTLQSDDTSARLAIRVGAGAAIGPTVMIVRMTARFLGEPIVHEVKVPINVTK